MVFSLWSRKEASLLLVCVVFAFMLTWIIYSPRELVGRPRYHKEPNQPTNPQPRQQLNQQPKQQLNQQPKQQLYQQPKQQLNQQPKQQLNQQPKQQLNQQSKQQLYQQPKQQPNQQPMQQLNQQPKQQLNQQPTQHPNQQPKQQLYQHPKQQLNQQPKEQLYQQPKKQINQQPKQQLNQQPKEQPNQQPKKQPNQQPKEQPNQQTKQQPNHQPKEQPNQQPKQQPNQQPKERNGQRGDLGVEDPRDPRFYNIISEEEAMSYVPCQDTKAAVSIDKSKVILKDSLNGQFKIGDDIKATVISYDGYGKRKTTGGDQFRVTIENREIKASAPCVVTDNRNGTHTVICESLWPGTSTIYVTLAYTREAITSIYRIRNEILATRVLSGKFVGKKCSEETICHPNKTHLTKLTNYTELCDLTYINSGMPFYCGKPKDFHLVCQDLKKVRTKLPAPKLPVTKCEETLLDRGQRMVKQTVQVEVISGVHTSPTIPCSQYNRTQLWQSRKITGYYYGGKWIYRNCLGVNENTYSSCLRNRRVYLFGDSTLRHWYESMIQRFKCQRITEKWKKDTWHKDAECYNSDHNYYVGWYSHSQPFYSGKTCDEVKYTLYSISRRIDDIPPDTKAIIVFTLYMHLISYHHNVFRERMEKIRQSIEKFLLRSPGSIVMIKAPHTFEDTPAGSVKLSDYYGYVYSKILYEVFEGLHDKVVLLNNRDITIAKHEAWNHPAKDIVDVMIDQMLNYACN